MKTGRKSKKIDLTREEKVIFKNLQAVRNNTLDFYACLATILEDKDYSGKITTPLCEAFCISTILNRFGVGNQSDILLMTFGLLFGFRDMSLNQRRDKYIAECQEYAGIFDYRLLSEEKRKNRQNNHKTIEDPLIKQLVIAISDIADIDNAIEEARNYIDETGQLIPPKPSYRLGSQEIARHNLPVRNTNFVQRLTELNLFVNSFSDRRPVQVLSGFSGVGKTQLALFYAYNTLREYDYIVWLNAENRDSIEISTRNFLSRIDTDAQDSDGKSSAPAKSRLVSFLESHNNWLVIYDDLDYRQVVEAHRENSSFLLPANVGASNHVLITTNYNKKFFGVIPIEIGAYNNEDATSFLISNIKERDEKDTSLVANRLGNHPLALEYAASYIRETGITCKMYLERINKCSAFWLYSEYDSQTNSYQRTISEAFHLIIERLWEEARDSDEVGAACQFLAYSAYMSPHCIDLVIMSYQDNLPKLLRSCCLSEQGRDNLTRILTKYSLFSVEDGGTLSTHRLLQEALRDTYKNNRNYYIKNLLENYTNIIGDIMTEAKFLYDETDYYSRLLVHCEMNYRLLLDYVPDCFGDEQAKKIIRAARRSYFGIAMFSLCVALEENCEDYSNTILRICSDKKWYSELRRIVRLVKARKVEQLPLVEAIYTLRWGAIGCYCMVLTMNREKITENYGLVVEYIIVALWSIKKYFDLSNIAVLDMDYILLYIAVKMFIYNSLMVLSFQIDDVAKRHTDIIDEYIGIQNMSHLPIIAAIALRNAIKYHEKLTYSEDVTLPEEYLEIIERIITIYEPPIAGVNRIQRIRDIFVDIRQTERASEFFYFLIEDVLGD